MLFLTPTNPKGDFINCINPGLRLDAQITPKNRISVGWLGNAQIYSKYTDQSYFTQNFNIDLDLNLDFTRTGRLSFKVGNAIRSGLIEQSPENGRTRPYLRDTPYIQAGYVVSEKMKIVGFYQYDGFSFTKSVDKFNNYQQNSGGVTVFYKFWPKTAALLQYMFVSTTYPDSPVDNSTVHTVLTGLNWDPTAKINGTVKFGVSLTDYDQSAPDRNKTPTSFVTSVSTSYRYSKFTTFNLTVQRSKQDNINYDNAPYWNTGVFFTVTREWHYLKSTLYAGLSYTNNDYINPTLDGTVLKRGLPLDRKIIFFGAQSLKSRRKGLSYLVEALHMLLIKRVVSDGNIMLITCGYERNVRAYLGGSIPYAHLGFLGDESSLASAYQAADLFVCPSIEDSGPMMINETLMCGTPVVSFDMGVARDLVHTGKKGYRAELKNAGDLAHGIAYILGLRPEEGEKMGRQCRQVGLDCCHPKVQAASYIDLFRYS